MMRVTKVAVAALTMSGAASMALACDMPPLVAIPEKEAVGDKGPQIQAEFQKYYDGMKAYSACVQAELKAAGQDTAPTLMKAVLVQRNNSAAAEVEAVLKALNAAVPNAGAAAGAAPTAAPPAKGDGGRRRDR
jgi:hypothetical protein